MSAGMFVDPSLVPLCQRLAAAAPVFAEELGRLALSDFVPWFDVAVYEGGWFVHPLVAALDPLPPGFDLERSRQRCPRSCAWLLGEPQVLLAGFSRLLPGAAIRQHVDRPAAGVLRCHLGFASRPDCALSAAGVARSVAPGRVVLFDHSMPHSAHNRGTSPRDVLLVDIRLTAAEAAAVRAARGAVQFGPLAGEPAPGG